MYFRGHVEDVIIKRLSDTSKDIKEVSSEEFDYMLLVLRPLLYNSAYKRNIYGFTSEDLYSFLVLKLHQLMRRGQYDHERPNNLRFLKLSFSNLFNDINRMKDRCLARGFELDPLDDCLTLSDRLVYDQRDKGRWRSVSIEEELSNEGTKWPT